MRKIAVWRESIFVRLRLFQACGTPR